MPKPIPCVEAVITATLPSSLRGVEPILLAPRLPTKKFPSSETNSVTLLLNLFAECLVKPSCSSEKNKSNASKHAHTCSVKQPALKVDMAWPLARTTEFPIHVPHHRSQRSFPPNVTWVLRAQATSMAFQSLQIDHTSPKSTSFNIYFSHCLPTRSFRIHSCTTHWGR